MQFSGLIRDIVAGAAGEQIDAQLIEEFYPHVASRDAPLILSFRESFEYALEFQAVHTPGWRVERIAENGKRRWYCCLEHRTKVEWDLKQYVNIEAASPARAVLAAALMALAKEREPSQPLAH